MTTTKTLYLEDVEIGDQAPTIQKRVTREEALSFLEVWQGPQALERPSRFNSLEQAKKEGLPGPIVPGIMSMALLSRMLTDWSATVQLQMMDVIFRQVVPQETEIKVYAVVTDKNEAKRQVEVDLYVEPLDGQPFIRGKAVVALPSKAG